MLGAFKYNISAEGGWGCPWAKCLCNTWTICYTHKNLLTTDSYMAKSYFMVLFDHMHWPLSHIMMKLEVNWVTKHWERELLMLLPAEQSLVRGTIDYVIIEWSLTSAFSGPGHKRQFRKITECSAQNTAKLHILC